MRRVHPQPSRWVSGSAGVGPGPDRAHQEGRGLAGLPGPAPRSRPSSREPGRDASGARCPTSRLAAACATPCTSSGEPLPPRRPSFASKATRWPSTCHQHRSRRGDLHAAARRRHTSGARAGDRAVPRRALGRIDREGGAVGDVAAERAGATARPRARWPDALAGPAASRRASSRPRSTSAHQLLALDPLQEPVHRTLMSAVRAARTARGGAPAVPGVREHRAAGAGCRAGGRDAAALPGDPPAADGRQRGGGHRRRCGGEAGARSPHSGDAAGGNAADRARDRDDPVSATPSSALAPAAAGSSRSWARRGSARPVWSRS